MKLKTLRKLQKLNKNEYSAVFLQGLSLQAQYDLFANFYNYFLRTSEVATGKRPVKQMTTKSIEPIGKYFYSPTAEL